MMGLNALITAAIAPLYTKPDAPAQLADEVLCGMAVEVLERAGSFWRVKTFYGYEGYTPDSALCMDPDRFSAWGEAPKKVVMQAYMDVQGEPRVQARILQSVTRGALVSPVGNPTDGWQKIRLCGGMEGWCWADFLADYLTEWDPAQERALRKSFVNTALKYLGTQYRWGGKTPLGIDCSGLCSMAYLLNGVVIWRDAGIRGGYPLHEIPLAGAGPGDLLFFPGHVAMLIGNDRYIHATTGNNSHGVVINSLDPRSADYRADLPAKITAAGSLFGKPAQKEAGGTGNLEDAG